MDIAQFEKLAKDPKRTRSELEQMKANALAKGSAEFAAIASDVLAERFSRVVKRSGGATPTTATFRSRSNYFDTGKDAYIWLVEQFVEFEREALPKYAALHQRAGTQSKGCRFARKPNDLYPEGSPRRGHSSYYVTLASGWYADTNLSHRGKFAALLQLSYVCGLEYDVDWDFRVAGATEELLTHQKMVVWARELLNDLLPG